MLADIKAHLEKTDNSVIVNADIRRAFDNVVIGDVLALHAEPPGRLKIDENLLRIIERALQGYAGSTVGIPQGNSYSPVALNLLLHTVHDIPLTELDVTPFWFRFADNLVYLVQDVNEGERVVEDVSRLLSKANLELKPGTEIVDMEEGQGTELLGFYLAPTQGEPEFHPLPGYSDDLSLALANCWDSENPPATCHCILAQWIYQHAPIFDLGGNADYFNGILVIAKRFGFAPNTSRLAIVLETATRKWRKSMTRARQRCRGSRSILGVKV